MNAAWDVAVAGRVIGGESEWFSAPLWFLLFVVVSAIAAGYVITQRMRRKRTMRFANDRGELRHRGRDPTLHPA